MPLQLVSDGRGGDSLAADLAWLVQHPDFLAIVRLGMGGDHVEYHVECSSPEGKHYGFKTESWDDVLLLLPSLIEGMRLRDAKAGVAR